MTNQSSGSISLIDTSTNSVSTTIPVGAFPTGIAITTDGKYTYVANQQSNSVNPRFLTKITELKKI